MFYIVWFLGVLLAVLFAAIVTISGEKTGNYEEE